MKDLLFDWNSSEKLEELGSLSILKELSLNNFRSEISLKYSSISSVVGVVASRMTMVGSLLAENLSMANLR